MTTLVSIIDHFAHCVPRGGSMLTREENELLAHVGPGTPTGEMLRRYWWPIEFPEHLPAKSRPVRVRLLGEDLVLFRDGRDQLGLMGLHCSHRGTSLEYSRVEDTGIRWCYHGWLYDREGRCLDQPAEPEGSTNKDLIRLKTGLNLVNSRTWNV